MDWSKLRGPELDLVKSMDMTGSTVMRRDRLVDWSTKFKPRLGKTADSTKRNQLRSYVYVGLGL